MNSIIVLIVGCYMVANAGFAWEARNDLDGQENVVSLDLPLPPELPEVEPFNEDGQKVAEEIRNGLATEPQRDFFGMLINFAKGAACGPVCDRYRACKIACLNSNDIFSCPKCEMDPLKHTCQCQFTFNRDLNTGQIHMGGRPAGKTYIFLKIQSTLKKILLIEFQELRFQYFKAD